MTTGKHHTWSTEDDALLGTDTDIAVGKHIGRSPYAVHDRRKKLGIKPFVSRNPWTPEEDSLLPGSSDAEVAKKTGRVVANVRSRRKHLGIAAPKERRIWTDDELYLLGRDTDSRVAVRTRRSKAAVTQQRIIRGIRRHAADKMKTTPLPAPWTEDEIALVGCRPDGDIAIVVGRGTHEVAALRVALGRPDVSPLFELASQFTGEPMIALAVWYERRRQIPDISIVASAFQIYPADALAYIDRLRAVAAKFDEAMP